MSNKKARKKLIKLYGAECFIEKLHLRTDTEPQKQMNELFQKYKHSVECSVEFVDELDIRFSIASAIIVPAELEKEHYNRAKEKRAWQREIEEER